MTQTSWKSETFRVTVGFLPDRAQTGALGLVVLAVLASRGVKLRRRSAHRRAARSGRPVHAAARYGQGRGADHLGAYAPQPRPDDTTA